MHTCQDVQQGVPCKHVNPQTDSEGHGTETVGDGLQGHENEGHGPGGSSCKRGKRSRFPELKSIRWSVGHMRTKAMGQGVPPAKGGRG